jgi:hypothetical protein
MIDLAQLSKPTVGLKSNSFVFIWVRSVGPYIHVFRFNRLIFVFKGSCLKFFELN